MDKMPDIRDMGELTLAKLEKASDNLNNPKHGPIYTRVSAAVLGVLSLGVAYAASKIFGGFFVAPAPIPVLPTFAVGLPALFGLVCLKEAILPSKEEEEVNEKEDVVLLLPGKPEEKDHDLSL